MKNLSELSNDTILTVAHQNDGDFSIMTKEEFLDCVYFHDFSVESSPEVTIAKITTKKFTTTSLEMYLEQLGWDDTYEDWDKDVMNYLLTIGYANQIVEMMNEAFTEYPIYYEGERVIVDIQPEDNTSI